MFISGINYKLEENDIRNTFLKNLEIVHYKILKGKETNKSKGIGFAKFKEKYQAYNAMKDAENIEFQGKKLKINYSNIRTRDNNNKNSNYNNKNRNYGNIINNNFSNYQKEENNNDNEWIKDAMKEKEIEKKLTQIMILIPGYESLSAIIYYVPIPFIKNYYFIIISF